MQNILGVCPHDVASDPEKWRALSEYLQAKSGFESQYVRITDFIEFGKRMSEFGLVYVHPLHAVQLHRDHGFIPLAKYHDTYDEAVFICPKNSQIRSLDSLQGLSYLCIHGAPSHAAMLIDLARNRPEIKCTAVGRSDYAAIIKGVSLGEADFGLILNSVWDGMVSLKDRVRPFYTTATASLVHVFMIAPSFSSMAESLRAVLLNMHEDESGAKILQRLGCRSLVQFENKDVVALARTLEVCQF